MLKMLLKNSLYEVKNLSIYIQMYVRLDIYIGVLHTYIPCLALVYVKRRQMITP